MDKRPTESSEKTVTRIASIASLFGLDAFGIVGFLWSLRAGPLEVVGTLTVAPAGFLLITCFSGALTVTIFWKSLRLLRPENRFGHLTDEARELAPLLAFSVGGNTPEEREHRMTTRSMELIFTLSHKLERLKIRHPSPHDLEQWYDWLPQLTSWAETKNLRAARNYEPRSGSITFARVSRG